MVSVVLLAAIWLTGVAAAQEAPRVEEQPAVGAVNPPAAVGGGTSPVRIERDPSLIRLGLGPPGLMRFGEWTPLRLALNNASPTPQRVLAEWQLEDENGDRVLMRQEVTLSPGVKKHRLWLYGCPATGRAASGRQWTVRVYQLDEAGEVGLQLDELILPAPGDQNIVPAQHAIIGVVGRGTAGLQDYLRLRSDDTLGQEARSVLLGLRLRDLPDRWYGLSLLNTLIWTPGPDDSPTSADVLPAQIDALRAWVRRGGHLVIIMPPSENNPWLDPTFADLLPVDAATVQVDQGPAPSYVGGARPADPIWYVWFDLPEDQSHRVVLRDDFSADGTGRPGVVAGRVGFGRVTLIGTDLTLRELAGKPDDLPISPPDRRLWNAVFGWQEPAHSPGELKRLQDANQISTNFRPNPQTLGSFMIAQNAEMAAVAPLLLLAVLLFLGYWAAATVGSFALLKAKRLERWSWLAFAAVVMGFAAVAWGGAWLVRPTNERLDHLTVLDYDLNAGQVRASSWLSVFVPTFDAVTVRVGDQVTPGTTGAATLAAGGGDTLSSPGLATESDGRSFPDQRAWSMPARSPDEAAIPFRSTSKQLQLQYAGREPRWPVPRAALKLDAAGAPTGALTHALPGPIQNVMVVFVPGRADSRSHMPEMPIVWRVRGEWGPGKPLHLSGVPPGAAAGRLVGPPIWDPQGRRMFSQEGLLGGLVVSGAGDQRAQLEMLSFYDLLPPINYRPIGSSLMGYSVDQFQRPIGRWLDLSHLATTGRRVIVLGVIDDASLPVPLTVDGGQVPSNGTTMVRMIYDL